MGKIEEYEPMYDTWTGADEAENEHGIVGAPALDGRSEVNATAAVLKSERELIDELFDAWHGLVLHGWREARYAPKDRALELIEPGSTGIHRGSRDEIGFWVADETDTYPSLPILYRELASLNVTVNGRETCVWDQMDYPGGECWDTDCGECFRLDEGAPSDNRMKFCCYCGKALEERLFVEEAEEEEVQP